MAQSIESLLNDIERLSSKEEFEKPESIVAAARVLASYLVQEGSNKVTIDIEGLSRKEFNLGDFEVIVKRKSGPDFKDIPPEVWE